MRTVLALTLSVILASAVQAEAGEVVVVNCTNDPGAVIEAKSFNSTDLVLIAPYESKKIRKDQSDTLSCATEYCVVGIEYPKKTKSTSIGISSAMGPSLGSTGKVRPRVGAHVSSGRVCAYPMYADGVIQSGRGYITLETSSCKCD